MDRKYDWDKLMFVKEFMSDLIMGSVWWSVFFFLSNSIVEVMGEGDVFFDWVLICLG